MAKISSRRAIFFSFRCSIVIAATSEQPSLVKIKAAFVATSIAEYFRDKGKNVLFMLDSITRIAMAQREVGLAIGELIGLIIQNFPLEESLVPDGSTGKFY